MNIGKMRHRLILQQPVSSQNTMDETVVTWTDMATVWGQIDPATGSWYFQAKQANSNVTGRVHIRYRSDIDPTWRIQYGTRYLNIVSIINVDEKNRELLIMYSESLD